MGVFMLIFVGLLAIAGCGVCTLIAARLIAGDDTDSVLFGGAIAGVLAGLSVLAAARSGHVATGEDAAWLGGALFVAIAAVAVTRLAHTRLWQGLAIALAALGLVAAALLALERGLGVIDIARDNLQQLGLD